MPHTSSDKKILPVDDIRMCRPFGIRSLKDQQTMILQRNMSHKLKDKDIHFSMPNNVSICMSISRKESDKAKKIYNTLVKPKFVDGNNEIEFTKDEIKLLYDYFEHVQTSIIFIYTAIETFCNLVIPLKYEHEIINNKKIKEIWNKDSIERWMSTKDKLEKVIPEILEIEKISNQKDLWDLFKELELVRNNLIHQKKIDDMKVYVEFLDPVIFKIVRSGFIVIEYLCSGEKQTPDFPVGMGKDDIEILEVDCFEDMIERIE